MSKLKHEVKALTYHEVGMKMDDALESARRELNTFEGAKQAFQSGRVKVEELTKFVDKDVEEGLISLDQAVSAKKYIIRAINILSNLGIQAEVQHYQAQGRVMGLDHAVKVTKNLYDSEKAKFEAILEAEKQSLGGSEANDEGGRPKVRPVGVHPGNDIADRKREATLVEVAPEPESSELEVIDDAGVTLTLPKKRTKKVKD